MQKYATQNMQQYARICLVINMQIYAKYMHLYALYDDTCNPKYVQNIKLKICRNIQKMQNMH